jgi:hypothetical protein
MTMLLLSVTVLSPYGNFPQNRRGPGRVTRKRVGLEKRKTFIPVVKPDSDGQRYRSHSHYLRFY